MASSRVDSVRQSEQLGRAVDVREGRRRRRPGRGGASVTGTSRPKTFSNDETSSRTVTPSPVPTLMIALGASTVARTSSNFSIARTWALARSSTWM